MFSDEDYNNYNVIHLQKNNFRTSICHITSRRDDFTTAYGELWRGLSHLYHDPDVKSDQLLNSMRRILETYTKFNGRNWKKFCEKAGVSLKMFHEGSHAITDLSEQANIYSKDELVKMFYKCFAGNGAGNHVKYYWKDIESIVGV